MYHVFPKAILSTALGLGVAVSAHAGGYVPPVVEETVVVTPAPADWQGGYAGLTLGYALAGDDDVGVRTPTGFGTPDELELSGVNAGLRIGYRWQRDRWVFGPELGFEAGNVDDDFSTDGYEAESEIKNVFALRFKTGYVLDNDMLVYGIIGAARAKIDYKVEGTGSHGTIGVDDDYSETGYIVGFGIEKMMTERMSLTGEYEYANFGKDTRRDGLGGSTQATPDYHNLKVGLNFRF
ncbi:outer membrane immunogenic protein [Paracoccus halophilus]|uniref:Membrane protein n=1 Tax=Paracoccus halophilus TaxID=376733 RepID=A0A099EYW5_9RHOB|nr:outer membrane beta-barrel protein [Paracoccus halophilus]KGJ03163.1 membrane protein [Paracoccus halophilus]SFA59157.1 outer membrane immunogenic protein [Paracoccus halophilus]